MAALIPHLTNYSHHHCVGGNDYYSGNEKRACVFYNVCHRDGEGDVLYYYVNPHQPKLPMMSDNNAYIYNWRGDEVQIGVYSDPRFTAKWAPRTVFEPKPDYPYDTAERAFFFHSFGEDNPGHFMDLPHVMFVSSLLHGYEHSKDTRLIDTERNTPGVKNRNQLLSAISRPPPYKLSSMGNVCFKTLFAGAGGLAGLEGSHVHALTVEKFRDAVIEGYDFPEGSFPLPTRHKIVIIQKSEHSMNQFNRFHDHDQFVEYLKAQFDGIADVENMHPEMLSWRQQVEIVHSATIVISTAGGGSYLASFARNGATIIISDRNFKGKSVRDPATIGQDDNWWTQFHSITSLHYTVCTTDECDGDVFIIKPRMFLTILLGMITVEKYPLAQNIPTHLRIETLWRSAESRGATMPTDDLCKMSWHTETFPNLQAELVHLGIAKTNSSSAASAAQDADGVQASTPVTGESAQAAKEAAIKKNRGWHAYNSSQISAQKKEEGCQSYDEATKPYPKEFVEKLSLWRGVSSEFDEQTGETLFGSQAALQAIYDNQNPEDCSKAKFLVSSGWPFGFGSRIHQEGSMLAIAMQLGRVYLSHPDGDNIFWETKVPFCRKGGDGDRPWDDEGLTCFYAPFSKCNMGHVLAGTGGDVNHLPMFHSVHFNHLFDSKESTAQMLAQLEGAKSIVVDMTTAVRNDDHSPHAAWIPFSMFPILECSPLRQDAYLYWWRAVSATFIARPNQYAVKALAKYALPTQISDYQQCVAMFVRHGDKGVEMKLLDFPTYRDTATMMWEKGLVPGAKAAGGTSAAGTLFITTEDPAVLQEAEKWAQTSGWTIKYTNLFDRLKQTAYQTWDQKNKKGTVAVHDDLEYLSMMLNLEYALKCEAWVCTLASNSCRMIDELRCTVGAKCNRHYADLSGETCSNPPCVNGSGQIYSFGEIEGKRRRR